MKKLVLIFIYILLMSFCFNDGPWVFRKEKGGVKVYSKSIKGSNYQKSKATASIKTDLNSYLKFIMNPVNYKNFSPRIDKIKVIKQTKNYALYYMSVDMPWPIYNRDGIYEVTLKSKTDKEMVITAKAKPNYIPVQEGYIRIQKSNTYYKLTKNGDKVNLYYTVHTDPNGNVPAWVANYFVEDGPISNVLAMKKALE